MKSLCVYCGSSNGKHPTYRHAAAELGKLLAQKNITLVYGGGNVGLMGAIADSVLDNGGKAIGVIPHSLVDRELAHNRLTELHKVHSMHERKKMMADLSDGFMALPGGVGTLDELFEIITWSQLHIHTKPVGLLNVDGYFDKLIEFLNQMTEKEFIKPDHIQKIAIEKEAPKLLEKLLSKS